MSKIKKLVVIIFIVFLAILGINIESEAYSVGQKLKFNYYDYLTKENLYCMEHKDKLRAFDKTYEIISHVKLEGRTSTDHKGKSIDSWYNSKMLAILSEDNGSDKSEGPVQNAIWNFGYTWMQKVGQHHAGLYLGFANNKKGEKVWLDNYASGVADDSKEQLTVADNTNKDKIKIVGYEKDGKEYVRVGPFNWSFSTNLTSIKVYNQNNKEIDGILYSRFKSNTQEWIKVSEIKSEKEFYISIPVESGTTKITKIVGTMRKRIDTAEIWFLEAIDDSFQNLIMVDPGTKREDIEGEFTYDIELMGDLLFEKVDNDNKENKLANVEFIIKNNKSGKYVKSNNGTITYVEKSQATRFKSNENGRVEVKNLLVGKYTIYEVKNPNYGYEDVSFDNPKKVGTVKVEVGKRTEEDIKTITNTKNTGNIKLYKKDYDSGKALAGMEFIIKASNGKYVIAVDSNGKKMQQVTGSAYFADIKYIENIDGASKFITDDNGTLTISNIAIDTYEIIEYSVGDNYYGYEVDGDYIHWEANGKDEVTGESIKVELVRRKSSNTESDSNVTDKYSNVIIVKNRRKYVKLSGYVWIDKIAEKTSVRNDLFKENDYENGDILLDGITVRLKDKITGNTIKETVTSELGRYKDSRNNGHGEYLFEDILTKDLENYYIEFEYDGLTYTNVVPHIDKDNGSKAAENASERTEFNKNFSVVEGKTESTGITRDANGNEKHNLSYNIDKNEHTATLINNGQYMITANTSETGYSIEEHLVLGQEEIKYINLGLYEREQPDIAILKDLENVKIVVNGYNHIYQYAQRFVNQGEYGDGFNVGVKFGNKYGTMSYTRAIYKADYEYVNEQDKDKELKVYVTYKIAVRNESTNLIVRVNNLVDYFDSRYSIEAIGTTANEDGTIGGNINYQASSYNNEYAKAIINTNMAIDAQQQQDIYVQFKLNREAVLNILNDGENLENVVEINSYSVFDAQENIYAGIDKDSNPGNITPEDKTLYQDDTDSAPALKLEVADGREMSGKVFVDKTSNELKIGEIRQGNGAYEDGENTVEGVKVTLTENTGTGKVYEAITDANGDFVIKEFIPGDYTLTYTWGDATYTVQNYKATIYDSSRDQNDKQWYKKDVDNRLSDALDDYELRQRIDNELKVIVNSTTTTIDKMNSTTPTMGIGVEYETTYTASSGDRYVYAIRNIDFGIVERARQSVELNKRVSSFKATLPNGQVIVDAIIDENGQMTGLTQHLTNMGPVKLELDSELIQGTTIEVGYEIKATNGSELDYLSSNYYHYGKIEGEVITITPTAVIDYLDKDWGFEEEKNPDWQIKQLDEVKSLLAEVVYNNPNSTINEKIILYTESLKAYKLEPTESAAVNLYVSKILSNSDDIELNNETEMVRVDKPGGPKPDETPGNFIPGSDGTEPDDDKAETVIVTPSTGDNRNFISIIITGVTAFMILGAGIVLIKKKIL